MKPVHFTPREFDIMCVLWERGPSTVSEVRAELTDELAHNTVLTLLTILEAKGYVRHTKEGRAFVFHPRIGHHQAGSSIVDRIIERMFGGSTELLLRHIIRERDLASDELHRMRALLDEELTFRR